MKGIREFSLLSLQLFCKSKIISPYFFLKRRIKTLETIKQSTDTRLVGTSLINHTHEKNPNDIHLIL